MATVPATPTCPAPLPAERLRWRCDPAALGFATTDEVPPLDDMVGQDRALEAIAFGLELDAPGYNLYVVGPPGTGRTTTIRDRVARVAAGRPAPTDWCYLHSFLDPARPLAVELPTGRGRELARALDDFVAACRRAIPQALAGEQQRRRRAEVAQRLEDQREALLDGARALADRLGFTIAVTPAGIASTPLLAPGQPYTPQAFALLPAEKQAELRAAGQQVEGAIAEAALTLERLEREAHEALHQLDRGAVELAAGSLLAPLRARYADVPAVARQLDAIQADLVEHFHDFERAPDGQDGAPLLSPGPGLERYRANALLTNEPGGGAPVVFEPNPTYYNLLGRVDYRAAGGAMVTDVTLIQPGALHRARGGFLILPARDVLTNPGAWQVLKRALFNREVRIENPGEQVGAFPTATLKPEPVPLATKVVLIGDLETYLLLLQLDEDFTRLFKVKAQFSPDMERSPAALAAYAGFVSAQVRALGLPPFRGDAVARVLEHGARLAEDQGRLTARLAAIGDIVAEAADHARRAGAAAVGAADVEAALAAQERRLNLPEEELRRLIDTGAIAIDTRARVVGQVNGLAVTDLGDYAFARPARITAQVGLGSEGVLNIEREADLSGPTHSKGVLTLTGYLLGQYAGDLPLALSARLAFEQTYSEVDGDSASSAELYALLSRLAGLPARQDVAVTGSVSQQGAIQAVGAVTRKVEGFFAVCRAQGLTGTQGVAIPAANARNLVLNPEVVEAVGRGQFHIWPVETVDQGLELLLGVAAGRRQPDGTYPPGTVHELVRRRLAALADRLTEYTAPRRPVAAPRRRARVAAAASTGRPRRAARAAGDCANS